MSPHTDGLYINNVNSIGGRNSVWTIRVYGVRPSINLKSNVKIIGGNGTKSNPYVIEGDKDTGEKSEPLNNRISGEYINFNDVLYRIVGIEEIEGQKLTKITMADYSLNKNTLASSLAYGESDGEAVYNPTYGIGLYLELDDYRLTIAKQILEEIRARHEKGQPILVGTISVETSEIVSDIFMNPNHYAADGVKLLYLLDVTTKAIKFLKPYFEISPYLP